MVINRLYSIEDYYKMAEFGIIKPNEKLELINGEIYKKLHQTPQHAAYRTRLNRLFERLNIDAIISVGQPLRLDNWNEPEPDGVILKYRNDFYVENHPTGKDTFFLTEVAEKTLHFDQNIKSKIYATAEIPVYWIVNLVKKQLEVYQNPLEGKYTTKTILKQGDKVMIPHFDIEIEVSEIIK